MAMIHRKVQHLQYFILKFLFVAHPLQFLGVILQWYVLGLCANFFPVVSATSINVNTIFPLMTLGFMNFYHTYDKPIHI